MIFQDNKESVALKHQISKLKLSPTKYTHQDVGCCMQAWNKSISFEKQIAALETFSNSLLCSFFFFFFTSYEQQFHYKRVDLLEN